jgi:cell division septum initiation protein DivIVA
VNPFKSNTFASNAFAGDTFRGTEGAPPVPVPELPAAISAGSGGWGGGKGLTIEDLPPEAKEVDSEQSTHATVSKARNARRFLDGIGQSSTELRRTATELRAKVNDLERELAAANERSFAPWALYLSALDEIGKLKAAVAEAEAKAEALKVESAVSHFQPDPEADFVYDYTPLENISLPSFESIWQKVVGVQWIPAVKETEPFPWKEMALAAAGFILTANAPEDWKAVRIVGYACSSALALSAARKLLRHLS